MPDDAVPRLGPPVTDVLGDPWVQRRISLRPSPDDGGHPEAVLVHRRETTTSRRAVLYLHGFTDYFFQTEHAERWAAAGFDFYALDVRASGRAIRGRDRPGDVRDLRHHDEEIGVALGAVRADGHEQVVLLGQCEAPRVVLADAPLDDLDLREHAAKAPGEVDLVVSFADEDTVRHVRSAA